MPLDPQARMLLDRLAELSIPPVAEMGVEQARLSLAAVAALCGPGPEVAAVDDVTLPGPGGPLAARVYTPAPAGGTTGAPPVTVWFHGGGFALGSVAEHDGVCRRLANASRTVVVSVEYRLAPEHPHPAAVEDSEAAVRWVREHAATLGADGERIAVAGESAGGNLAAVTALRADGAGAPLAFQLLVCPVLDAEAASASYVEHGEGNFLTAADMRFLLDQYLPPGVDRRDPSVSPLHAEDLSGAPPAHVVTAEYDPLRDEAEEYARRLRDAGVAVTLRRYDGMIHGFFSTVPLFAAGERAIEEAGRALREALSR